MSNSTTERLYHLLPAIYRIRDASRGEPLRALLGVIESELKRIEGDIDGLYDNGFIETCDEWVVPYIGDLLGVQALHPIGNTGISSQRPYVANTLAYRRRKGTAPVLEQLARDMTGWPARAVEFFQLLGVTQHVNHVRLENVRTPDLRYTDRLELLHTPFEEAAYTADVRRIGSNRGRYNIPNIGLFLWRLQSYAVTRSSARQVDPSDNRRYTFHPLGYDNALFNRPQTETEITHLAEEQNVPGELRRRPLYHELEARRQAFVNGETPATLYFGDQPVLQVFRDSGSGPLAPEEIVICDLSEWDDPAWQPPASRVFTNPDGESFQTKVAVDPVLGRLVFLRGVTPSKPPPEVSYVYGFSGDVGGGPYNRRDSLSKSLSRAVTWQVGVSAGLAADDETHGLYKTLTKAVETWNQQPPGTVGIITIMDNRTYIENLTGADQITIPPSSQLLIVAADWPEVELTDLPGQMERRTGQMVPEGLRPHLLGDLSVKGTATGDEAPGELVIDGLLIEGKVPVLAGNLGRLRVAHCTLVPDKGGLEVHSVFAPDSQNDQLRLIIYRSICGPISLSGTIPELSIQDSIVDRADGSAAIKAFDVATTVQASTVIGPIAVRSLEAGNSIFDTVTVERRQTGCVRFSYVPKGSQTPRRYQCQPDLVLLEVTAGTEQVDVNAKLTPSFTSTQHGNPAYAQLRLACAEEIRTGAEGGSEMGVFAHLQQPQREANLRAALKEYLSFGLEAGIFYVM